MRLFDRFIFHPELPAHANVELIGKRYWIEPVMNERAIAGYDEKTRPVLARQPLEQAGKQLQARFALLLFVCADSCVRRGRSGKPQ